MNFPPSAMTCLELFNQLTYWKQWRLRSKHCADWLLRHPQCNGLLFVAARLPGFSAFMFASIERAM